MSDHEGLEPPKGPPVTDRGAHQLAESSDSEDQFTDAQSAPMSPGGANSPIPKTRVEKVDDEPSYGEVPGTEAYKMRAGDAAPDEIAIASDEASSEASTSTAAGNIPATLVEEASGDTPRPHSKEFEDKRKADASPDLVLDSDGGIKAIRGENISDAPTSPSLEPPQPLAPPLQDDESSEDDGDGEDDDDDDADDFGDDFDDFEEGGEDDDFDDFDDGFQQAEASQVPKPGVLPAQQATLPFPIPDFDGLDPESVISTTAPYLAHLFPPEELDLPAFPPLSKDSSIFLTTRSASLWSQLVAPPPLAPPDWIRSRTRRLFLVSLGVPVDLDEILPASKQKKLVLPSLNIPANSPRTSSDSRSVSRLRQGEGNASSTSVDTQGKPSTSKRRKGPPPRPDFDLVAARHLCMTTDEALGGMTDEELKAHVSRLEAMEGVAKEALEYWQKRTDEKIGDREAFEGVIENLVKHARKVRK
ncbi:Fc.00g113160.m01.CDS01 [Cosmosporella sp. VM-42]